MSIMTQDALINELDSMPPLRPNTFEDIRAAATRLCEAPTSQPLRLEDDPLYDDVEGGEDEDIIAKRWGSTLLSSVPAEEGLTVIVYDPEGSRRVSTALPKLQQTRGLLLGKLIFEIETDAGRFNGKASMFEDKSIVTDAEWYLRLHAGQANRSITAFARKLGLREVWKKYADDLENRGHVMNGEFNMGQSVGGSVRRALSALANMH